MLGVSFQLPAAWTVKTDGRYVLIASHASAFNPWVFPWITFNLCDYSEGHCLQGTIDLSKDQTCAALERSVHEWSDDTKELRWSCPDLLNGLGQHYSSTITQFQVGDKTLVIYYLATDHDTSPNAFLDQFARTLRLSKLP